MRTRGCRVEPIGEILRFVGDQSFAEFHDAHRVRWYAVISKYEFSDPEIAAADNSPDRKTLLVWLDGSALLNVVPAADPLARLRIIKHSILAVDFMFDLEIARVRSTLKSGRAFCIAANGGLVPDSGIIRPRCERPSRPAAPELRWDAEPGKLAGLARQGQDLAAASREGRLAARRIGPIRIIAAK